VLADLADAGETVLFEKLDRRAEEEAALRLAARQSSRCGACGLVGPGDLVAGYGEKVDRVAY
jgi:hypothetical protein